MHEHGQRIFRWKNCLIWLTLHRYGVRGYVTLNTLIFTEELQQFAETLAAISDAGTDAVLGMLERPVL